MIGLGTLYRSCENQSVDHVEHSAEVPNGFFVVLGSKLS